VEPRIVVLASGSGTLLQALLDSPIGVSVVAVGSDSDDAPALDRAVRAGLPTFVVSPGEFATRGDWDAALLEAVQGFRPGWVVSAGFMRILAPVFVAAFPGRIINTHPALLPSFPGAHGVRDALRHGVKVSGCTVHFVDEGVDTGPIIAQRAVAVIPGDTEAALHERIKSVERELLVETLTQLIGAPS
jgi:phosphoribosylglycinamide formyltransferase-1